MNSDLIVSCPRILRENASGNWDIFKVSITIIKLLSNSNSNSESFNNNQINFSFISHFPDF